MTTEIKPDPANFRPIHVRTFHGGDRRSRDARDLGHERAEPDHEQLGLRAGHGRPLSQVGAGAEYAGEGAADHHGSDGLVPGETSDSFLELLRIEWKACVCVCVCARVDVILAGASSGFVCRSSQSDGFYP